jgi:hypothetical protein
LKVWLWRLLVVNVVVRDEDWRLLWWREKVVMVVEVVERSGYSLLEKREKIERK